VPIVREIERSFAAGCERPGFRLVHYSLQGNHAHLIVEADDRVALGRGMMAIATRIARAVNTIVRGTGRIFAERYHVRMLSTPREVHRALRYVLLNARHHAATACAAVAWAVRFDPASSARWFDGWTRAEPANDRPTVARVKTWLLTVGWRRHGAIDPAYVPG
jgi:hypothetical protein